MSDDSLFREVDEAVRQDQLKTLWDKYGVWILIGALTILFSLVVDILYAWIDPKIRY